MCGGETRGARDVRRWAGASTRAERALALAAAALGAALAALAVLLAAHLAACPPAPFVGGRPKSPPINFTHELIESRISTRCSAGLPGLPESSTSSGVPDVLAPEPPDGEPVDEREYGFVLALVKVEPAGVTFGCVLSMLTAHWTVTAASCVESIEEVDSLESFVMMEGSTAVAVGGVRAAAGLALVRAARALRPRPAPLAAALDFHRFAIGERLMLLGFGKFRSAEAGGERRLRAAGVVRLPAAECAGADGADGVDGADGADGVYGADGAAPRHLRPAPAARAARCAAAPLCTGVLFGRAQPCQYCAGAALVWRGALAGVWGATEGTGAGAGSGCGGACGPAPAPRLAAAAAALRAAAADHDDLL